jgi:hypothetical protein
MNLLSYRMRTGTHLDVRFLALCLIFVASGCNKALDAKAPVTAVPVEAATVIAKEIRVSHECNGRVSATNQCGHSAASHGIRGSDCFPRGPNSSSRRSSVRDRSAPL